MAKQTIKQQYDEIAKNGELFEQTNAFGGVYAVIDDGGEWVLYKVCETRTEEYCNRWQRIKYTMCQDLEKVRSYFTIYGRRHYLDNFMFSA